MKLGDSVQHTEGYRRVQNGKLDNWGVYPGSWEVYRFTHRRSFRPTEESPKGRVLPSLPLVKAATLAVVTYWCSCGLSACGLVCTWSSNTLSQVLIEKAAAHLAKARVTCPLFLTEAPIFFLSSNSKNQLGPVVLFYKLTSMLPPDKESDFLKKCSHL